METCWCRVCRVTGRFTRLGPPVFVRFTFPANENLKSRALTTLIFLPDGPWPVPPRSMVSFRCHGTRSTSATFTAAILIASLGTALYGTLSFDDGVQACASVYTSGLGRLVGVPSVDRGYFWNFQYAALDLWGLLVYKAIGEDRQQMFATLRDSYGGTFPFRGGVAQTSYADVSAALRSPEGLRGEFLGATPVAQACFEPGNLLFTSTGKQHSELRNFMMSSIHRVMLNKSRDGVAEESGSGLVFPCGENACRMDDPGAQYFAHGAGGRSEQGVARLVTINVLARVFGTEFPSDLVDLITEYHRVGGICLLGGYAEALFPTRVLKIRKILKAVYRYAHSTSLGREMRSEAERRGWTKHKFVSILRRTVDSVLFSGLLPTGQLATAVLKRLRYQPSTEVPLFNRDPASYVLEVARLHPPITSVTSVVHEDTEFELRDETRFVLPRGATRQLVIALANMDPGVFGGAAHSRVYAESFDPGRENLNMSLSWNGLLGDRGSASSPRLCPGHNIGLDLVIQVAKFFLPSENEVNLGSADENRISGLVDRDELQRFTQMAVFAGLIASILYILCGGYASLGACLAHIIVAMALSRLGVVLGVKWLHSMPLYYDAAACLYFVHAYDRVHRGKSEAGNPCDQVNIFVRVMGSGAIAMLLFVRFGAAFPLFWELGSLVLIPARAAVWYRMALYMARGNTGVLSVLGFAGVTALLSPVLEHVETIHSVWLLPISAAATTMLVEILAGLPFLLYAVTDLDDEEIDRELDKLEEAEQKRRKDAVSQGAVNKDTGSQDDDKQGNGVSAKSGAAAAVIRAGRIVGRRARGVLTIAAVLVVVLAAALQLLTQRVSDGRLCPFPLSEQFKIQSADKYNVSAVCEETDVVRGLDVHTRFMHTLSHYLLKDQADDATPPPSVIQLPTAKLQLPKTRLGFGSARTRSGLDLGVLSAEKEITRRLTAESAMAKVTVAVHQFMNALPLVDLDEQWANLTEAQRVMEVVGERLPKNLVEWPEMRSDRAISQICFAGFAAHRLETCAARPGLSHACPDDSKFFVDLTFLRGLRVRAPFERYGAAAYFDKNRHLNALFWSHGNRMLRPGDDGWEHVKWVFKVSLVLGVTAVDHLVGTHMIWANLLTQATKTQLGPNHPLRRLLEIHTHNTIEINAAATRTLCVRGGLVHHASALTGESVVVAQSYGVKVWDYNAMPSVHYAKRMLESGAIKAKDWPFGVDYVDYYGVVHAFMKRYVDVVYKSDAAVTKDRDLAGFFDTIHQMRESGLPFLTNESRGARDTLVEVLATFVSAVTGFHNHVGTVSEYLKSPLNAAAKIRIGETHADVQSSFQAMNIALLTGLKAPMLLGDYSHLLEGIDNEGRAREVFESFQDNLEELRTRIESRNAARDFPCNAFNPVRLLTSVSV